MRIVGDDGWSPAQPLTPWDQNVCAEGHPRATDWAGGPELCIRGHKVIEHLTIGTPTEEDV